MPSNFPLAKTRRNALLLTEREGFEPSKPLNGVCVLSRDVPSATQPSFQKNREITVNSTQNGTFEQAIVRVGHSESRRRQ